MLQFFFFLGISCNWNHKQFPNNVTNYQLALEIDPTDASVYVLVANTYMAKGYLNVASGLADPVG